MPHPSRYPIRNYRRILSHLGGRGHGEPPRPPPLPPAECGGTLREAMHCPRWPRPSPPPQDCTIAEHGLLE
eukprot:728953-Pyramimonas_sp.AAC.1